MATRRLFQKLVARKNARSASVNALPKFEGTASFINPRLENEGRVLKPAFGADAQIAQAKTTSRRKAMLRSSSGASESWDPKLVEPSWLGFGCRVLGFRFFLFVFRVLGFWGLGVLGSWGLGVLGSWGFGVLGFWGLGVLGFWAPSPPPFTTGRKFIVCVCTSNHMDPKAPATLSFLRELPGTQTSSETARNVYKGEQTTPEGFDAEICSLLEH